MSLAMSSVHNVTSASSFDSRRQGAVIHSVTHNKEYKVHYGVQSATFVRTVFPDQVSGTYRINGMIPTWQGAHTTANFSPTGSSRAAGSPPVPYPPRNASAFYAPTQSRIVPNPCFKCYG